MIVSDCRLCGGSIGSHSDLCGSCGHDPYTITEWLITMTRREIMLALLNIVMLVLGLGVHIEEVRTVNYDVDKDGKLVSVTDGAREFKWRFNLIDRKTNFIPAKGKGTGAYAG